jgi:hypothetical protein
VSEEKRAWLALPDNIDDAWRVAKIISESSMVPSHFQNKPNDVLVALQWGMDVGIPGIQALQNIAVIGRSPAIWGDAALALIVSRADCEDVREFFEGDDAVCIIKRKDRTEVERRFTMKDASQAGLLGKAGPWKQYPKRMMQMRARSWAMRDSFPDALKGLAIAEEAQDIPENARAQSNVQSMAQSPEEPKAFDLEYAMAKIAAVRSPAEFATLFDIKEVPEDLKPILKQAMQDRKAFLLGNAAALTGNTGMAKQKSAVELLNECKTYDELQDVLGDMSDEDQMQNSDLIFELSDSLGAPEMF